jgi:cobalt-zinc-cadmium efflux system outer membrane protein
MQRTLFAVLVFVGISAGQAGSGNDIAGPILLPLDQLLKEASERNPTIRASRHRIAAASARVSQAGTLDDPEFTYMREEMPGFRWNEAVKQRLGIMQMIRFPSKLSGEADLARVSQTSTSYEEAEKVNDVFLRLRSAYYRWWYAQQVQILRLENLQVLRQVSDVTRTRFASGSAMLQDALKVNVEIARAESELFAGRQEVKASAAMLAALVDRDNGDSLGVALLPELPPASQPLDTLECQALRNRPMLLADSLAIEDGRLALSLARSEYLPDLRLGVEYVTFPSSSMTGWNLFASVSIPFAPWTIGKAGGRVEEARATIGGAEATYRATHLMVLSSVREMYALAEAARERESRFRSSIVPQAFRSLEASLAAYRAGKADILMILDTYRTSVDVKMEHLMSRMKLEESLAELDRTVGSMPAPIQ